MRALGGRTSRQSLLGRAGDTGYHAQIAGTTSFLPPGLLMDETPRILIVRLTAIGDVVHGLPVLCALRDRFPGAKIAWMVEGGSAQLLEGHPALDQLIAAPRHWLKSFATVRRLRSELKAFRPEIAIDVQGLSKSCMAAWLSGAKRRIGFGCEKGRELSPWLNTELVRSTATHIIDANLELLRPLGIENPTVRFGLPETEDDRTECDRILGDLQLDDRFALINVGAGWPSKLWRADRYAQVARHLGGRGLRSVVVWAGAEEETFAKKVVSLADSHAVLAPGTSLRHLASLCRRTALFIGSDTGPLHLAVAVGAPCIGLFGPMPAERNGPYGPQNIALQKASLEGIPRKRRNAPRSLMDAITAEHVEEACDEILGRQNSAAKAS